MGHFLLVRIFSKVVLLAEMSRKSVVFFSSYVLCSTTVHQSSGRSEKSRGRAVRLPGREDGVKQCPIVNTGPSIAETIVPPMISVPNIQHRKGHDLDSLKKIWNVIHINDSFIM